MRVSVLVLDGVFDSGLSVVLDTLATANDLAEGSPRSGRHQVTLCGLGSSATTQQGLRVPLTPAGARRHHRGIRPHAGCHLAAGSDAAHTPSPGGPDAVYTPVH